MNEMFESNKEGTKRKCNECGKVKSDVESRWWNGVDAMECDILCASCAEKKERHAGHFLIFYTGFVVVGIVFILLMASAALAHIY